MRNTPYKWLNLLALSQRLLPSPHEIIKIKYFTAHLSGKADPDQPRRQQIYFNALETIENIEIYFGKFLTKNVWRPIASLPVGDIELKNDSGEKVIIPSGKYRVDFANNDTNSGSWVIDVDPKPTNWMEKNQLERKKINADNLRVLVNWNEEKGSDVNLAAHLLNDAWSNEYDVAAVISNDSDLAEPIRILTQEREKEVIVISPHTSSITKKLSVVATSTLHIRGNDLRESQFPDEIKNDIKKPKKWS